MPAVSISWISPRVKTSRLVPNLPFPPLPPEHLKGELALSFGMAGECDETSVSGYGQQVWSACTASGPQLKRSRPDMRYSTTG